MKNRRILFLLLLALAMALVGCGENSHPDEAQMQQDVQQKNLNSIAIGENIHDLDIDSLEIEKEQIEDDFINAYCIIDMSDNDVAVTTYYNLHYNYYDKGGWILDSYSTYQDMEFLPLAGVSESKALEDLRYIYGINRIDSLEHEFTYINDELDLENNLDVIHYEVKTTSDIGVRIEKVDISYLFTDGIWDRETGSFAVVDEQTSYNLVGKEWVSEYNPGERFCLTVNFDEMDDKTITLTYHHDSYFDGYTTTETITLPYSVTDGIMYIDPFYYNEKNIFTGEFMQEIRFEIGLDEIVFKYGGENEYYPSVHGSLS